MKKYLMLLVCAALLFSGCVSAAAERGFQLSGGITWDTSKEELPVLMDEEPAVLNRMEQSGVYAMYFPNQSVSRYEDAELLAFFLQEQLAAVAYEMLETSAGERYEYLLVALESKYGNSTAVETEEGEALLLPIEEIGSNLWTIRNMVQWQLEDGTRILLFQTLGKVRLYYLNENLLTNWERTYAVDGL